MLTFVILCAFAVAIGSLTVHRIRNDFNHQVTETAKQLPSELTITLTPSLHLLITPPLADIAAPSTVIRVFTPAGAVVEQHPTKAPSLGAPNPAPQTIRGFRVQSVVAPVVNQSGDTVGSVIVQYARGVSATEATVKRVELFLLLGVLAGTAFALLAGMAIARRAMAPIAALTRTAAEIARTRDPSRVVPQPAADDEVAELAQTLQGMLRELDAARGETEAMLARQRQFVADASHELRTPLTSVLANL
ncbi:MAG TPA: histidine kinase dimerization/phospho-acceptor domain-containing protein, partial [Solirubrobacteraceae bacterium]